MQTSLINAAEDRKARLAHLRSLKRKRPNADEPSDDLHSALPPHDDDDDHRHAAKEPSIASKILSGRNYDPVTRGPRLGFDAPPQLDVSETLEGQAAAIESKVRAQAEKDAAEAEAGAGIDLFKLQPKKLNWDLRRDLDRMLEPLNVQTNNAIAKIVRERLAAEARTQREVEDGRQGGSEVGALDGPSADGVLDGLALVEGLKAREAEEAEEERRERQELDEA